MVEVIVVAAVVAAAGGGAYLYKLGKGPKPKLPKAVKKVTAEIMS